MLRRLIVSLCLVALAAPAYAQLAAPDPAAEAPTDAAATEVPDLSALDRDALQMLCENLYRRVAELEAQLEEVRAQLGGEHGGAVASVDGDTTAVPEGRWTVRVTRNDATDTSATQAQLNAENAKLPAINKRLDSARSRLPQMEAARDPYDRNKPMYKASDLNTQRQAVRSIEAEQRTVQLAVRRLQTEINQAQSERRVSAVTDDGVPCTLIARGAYVAVGSSLRPDDRYIITGRGQFSTSSGTIYIKTATPAE